MPPLNHTHSYIRWKIQIGHRKFDKLISGEPVYRCSSPDCTHYVQRSFLLGKRSACPKCGTEFDLDTGALNKAIPLCLNCRETKEGKLFRQARSVVDEILGEL